MKGRCRNTLGAVIVVVPHILASTGCHAVGGTHNDLIDSALFDSVIIK